MQIQGLAGAETVRPSRLNFAGWCMYCLVQECRSARCIEQYARSVWEVCGRCGGSEYVNGHRDPENAFERCNCVGGVVEAETSGRVAEVIELRPEPVSAGPVVYESWPSDGGSPVRWTEANSATRLAGLRAHGVIG
ncbi:hypothetical protein NONI108955_32470 [Nocardia ninae]